jgi:hypothetical protein
MESHALKVSGSRESLEELRQALMNDTQLQGISIGQIAADPTSPQGPVRVRESGLVDIIFMFLVEVPAGIAAHALYDYLREKLRKSLENAQVRVAEVTASQPD